MNPVTPDDVVASSDMDDSQETPAERQVEGHEPPKRLRPDRGDVR